MNGKKVLVDANFDRDIFSKLTTLFSSYGQDPVRVVKTAIDMMADEQIADDTLLGEVFTESGMGVPILAGYLENNGVTIPVGVLANLRVCELLDCLR